MSYSSKMDWCVLGAIGVTLGALVLGANYWLDGPVLLVLLLWAFPQSYETTDDGLIIRDALSRQLVPYDAITMVAAAPRGRVRISHGVASQAVMAPSQREAFLSDLAERAQHLVQRGPDLVLRDRYAEIRLVRRSISSPSPPSS